MRSRLPLLEHSVWPSSAWLADTPHPAPFKAVVKPVEGAGSDGVFICNSPDEVRLLVPLMTA